MSFSKSVAGHQSAHCNYYICMMSKCELFLFRKDKMKLKACSIHARARVRMSVVKLSCICLWKS